MKIVRLVLGALVAVVGVGLLAAGPAQAYPTDGTATAEINSTIFGEGATVVVTVQKTTPGPLTMQIFSAPVTIGTGVTGSDGTGSVSGRLPAGFVGQHTIRVLGAGGELFDFAIAIPVNSRPPVFSTTPNTPNGNGGGDLASTGAQVGLGLGAGLAAVVAGGLVLVASRRRSARH